MIWRRARPDPAAGLGDLEAALRTEGCPVCARAAGSDERWLDHFLYEGYLEPEAMQAVVRCGGFCAHHARRLEGFGLSATVALIYLALIDDCLPRLAAKRPAPLFPAADDCEACAQRREADRRECFFLALLLKARGTAAYGNPAVVCAPHLPRLVEYLDDQALADVISAHGGMLGAVGARLAGGAAPCRGSAEGAIRTILGPPSQLAITPAAGRSDAFRADADPVQRMRRRLRHLDACAVCAEIDDAGAHWLDWLARASQNAGDLADVLPLCRDHVRQACSVGGPAIKPLLAAAVLREAEERLLYARKAFDRAPRQTVWQTVRRMLSGAAARGQVSDSLRRGRECPLCRHLREVGERAVELLLALLESAEGRRAFESGYGLCVRHAAQALVLPPRPAAAEIVASTMHARLAVLRWELEEQLRRGAWQARPARHGAEAGAWLTAGPRFSGTVVFAGHGG